MASFCIPKNLVAKLKESAINKEIDIKKLYEMSSKERRDFFTKHTEKDLGTLINKEFEKAMVSKQKTALTDWAKSVFDPKAQTKPVYKNMLDKINSLDELGVLNPKSEKAFLEDLVSDKLGVNVTPAEVAFISKHAKKIDQAQIKLGDDFGNPNKIKENVDYFKAKKEMDDYLASLTPASNTRILTGTIGRGMMLFSPKSPLLNIASNIEVGFTEALTRRLATGQLRGANNKLARDYVKMANKVYQSSGYDIARMMSLKDGGVSGGRVLGDTVHAQGKGAIRKVGRIVDDIVFKQMMGAPDVVFAASHFADSVNLNSLKMAKGNKAKATEMMNDAMKLEPKTMEGEVLRAQAILDAQKATWTDKTWASKTSEGIRKILNDVTGDARLGDYALPFVKTPANVIATGMDYAGAGIPKALYKTVKAVRSGELRSKENMQSIARDLIRSGVGLTAAYLITAQLTDEDFVGAYDPARHQIEGLRNSNYNAVRIGNKWVSMDWFGPLAVPMTGMMYARKYGDTGGEKTFQYSKNVAASVLDIPGVADVYEAVRGSAYQKNQSISEMAGATNDYLVTQISSRLIPSFVGDVAKMVDPTVRKTNGGTDALKAKIPFLSKTLPAKVNVFGEEVEGEPAWSDILFGARVKTDKETPLITEIRRVSDANGKSINFTDWDKSSSQKIALFRKVVGDEKFNKAKIQYGKILKNQLTGITKMEQYKSLSDEDKLKLINSLDSDVMEAVMYQYLNNQ